LPPESAWRDRRFSAATAAGFLGSMIAATTIAICEYGVGIR
jgi:hypothetical protein